MLLPLARPVLAPHAKYDFAFGPLARRGTAFKKIRMVVQFANLYQAKTLPPTPLSACVQADYASTVLQLSAIPGALRPVTDGRVLQSHVSFPPVSWRLVILRQYTAVVGHSSMCL